MKKHHRVFREVNGPGPWPCYLKSCDELVKPDELVVHHLDEDHENNDPSNLTAMHNACHSSLHHSGKIVSDETRAKIAETRRGVPRSDETKAKIQVARRGARATAEARINMSAAQSGRLVTEEHKRKISETKRGKPWTPARRAATRNKEATT